MKLWLKLVLGTICGLVLILLAGFLLPSEHRVSRELLIDATPESIYPHVADLRVWPEWTAWSQRDPTMKISYSGPETGVGATQKWVSESDGSGSLTVTHVESPDYFAYELHLEGFNVSVGEFELIREGGSTRVIWLFNVSLGANPVSRWFGLVLDDLIGADFETGLDRLKARVEG